MNKDKMNYKNLNSKLADVNAKIIYDFDLDKSMFSNINS